MTIIEELEAVTKWLRNPEVTKKIKENNMAVYLNVVKDSKVTDDGITGISTSNFIGSYSGMVTIAGAMIDTFYSRALNESQRGILTMRIVTSLNDKISKESGET